MQAEQQDKQSSDEERRYSRRRAVRIPLVFRILHEGTDIAEMRLSSAASAEICDLGVQGIGVETAHIIVDGLHIGQMTAAHARPRVYLQYELPGGRNVRAVGYTVWCERVPGQRLYQVGMSYCELAAADAAAIESHLTL